MNFLALSFMVIVTIGFFYYKITYPLYEKLKKSKRKIADIKGHRNFNSIKKDDYNALRLIDYAFKAYPANNYIEFIKRIKPGHPEMDMAIIALSDILSGLDGLANKAMPLYDRKTGRIKGFVRLRQPQN